MENLVVFSKDQVLALPVDQPTYDSVSLNRKSTFINIYNERGEYSHSANILEMKDGQDYLFLAEVLRAAELGGKAALNSLAIHDGIIFRLGAVQTSTLNTNLKINVAKKEDWKKANQAQPAAPAQAQAQGTAIQQTPRF